MLNLGRITQIRDGVVAAQRLSQEEAHDSHQDRRVSRLALGLHLCRELADDIMEDAMAASTNGDHRLMPSGRLQRDHT